MLTRIERSDQRHDRWSDEEINYIIGVALLILNVQMEILQISGPFLMAIILQLPLCLHEL